MQITVSGKQVELSDALRTRVSDHLDVIASKYFDHALEAQVTFSRARSFFTCDINVHAGRGLTPARRRRGGGRQHARSTMRRSTSPSGCGAIAGGSTSTRATAPTASGPRRRGSMSCARRMSAAPSQDGDSRDRDATRR